MKHLILACLLLASPAFAQDGIDLSQAVYHGSPNIAAWPITVTLDGVEFKPGRASDGNTVGIRPIFDRAAMNRRWPDVKPVGWDGFIQYTLWACVKPQRIWHCAGLHEFWSDRNGAPRVWSGAPITTQWFDWVYRGQWGPEMEAYQPKLGDEIVFGLTAGDRRLMDLGDVRERTNFVRVPVVEAGIPIPLSTVTPTPPKDPETPNLPPVTSDAFLKALEGRIAALEQSQVETSLALGAIRSEAQRQSDLLGQTIERVEAVATRPIPASCRASLFGFGINCTLQ